MEDKAKVTELLLATLQATRCYSDLQSLTYEKVSPGYEHVLAVFPEGKKDIVVTWDSGIALIRDVIRGLEA